MKSRKCGKSAVDYLTFQRHLMYISGCMTVISLLGPLPANTMGKLLIETNAYFAKTTIGNLSVDNILIWGCFQTRTDCRINYRFFGLHQCCNRECLGDDYEMLVTDLRIYCKNHQHY